MKKRDKLRSPRACLTRCGATGRKGFTEVDRTHPGDRLGDRGHTV